MYKLKVIEVKSLYSSKMWKNFIDENKCISITDVDFALKKHNAKNIPDSDYIEFKTEIDRDWFILRYS